VDEEGRAVGSLGECWRTRWWLVFSPMRFSLVSGLAEGIEKGECLVSCAVSGKTKTVERLSMSSRSGPHHRDRINWRTSCPQMEDA